MKKRGILIIILALLIIAFTFAFYTQDNTKYSPSRKDYNTKGEIIEMPLVSGMNCLLLETLSPNSFQEGINSICNKACTDEKLNLVSADCNGEILNCECE